MFHSKFNLKPLFLEKMVFGNIILFDIKILQLLRNRGWAKKKYTNVIKSGGNILGQSASKRSDKLFIIRFPLKWCIFQ